MPIEDFSRNLNQSVSNQINEAQLNYILNSNPNFNFLYSNYTKAYDEPIKHWLNFGIDNNIINLVYGPDLEVKKKF